MPRKAKSTKSKIFVFKPWMVGQLRRVSRRYPPIYQCLNASKEEYFIESKSGTQMRRVRYKCNVCKNMFNSRDVAVDHIVPIANNDGFPLLPNGEPDWNTFIARLFCDGSNLQTICTDCHDLKSATEGTKRRKRKKQVKNS